MKTNNSIKWFTSLAWGKDGSAHHLLGKRCLRAVRGRTEGCEARDVAKPCKGVHCCTDYPAIRSCKGTQQVSQWTFLYETQQFSTARRKCTRHFTEERKEFVRKPAPMPSLSTSPCNFIWPPKAWKEQVNQPTRGRGGWRPSRESEKTHQYVG